MEVAWKKSYTSFEEVVLFLKTAQHEGGKGGQDSVSYCQGNMLSVQVALTSKPPDS